MVPVPQSIQPVPSPGPNPPLPSSPQVVNVPDSTQDKGENNGWDYRCQTIDSYRDGFFKTNLNYQFYNLR